MAREIQADERTSDLPFPLSGIDRSLSFSDQPGGTTHTGQNVRAHEPASGRAKGGSRPGLSRFIDSSVGGPVQMLMAVSSGDEEASLSRSLPVGDVSSPPAGYTDDPSSAGDASSWGQGDGKDWGADGTPGAGGQGGGSAGGGGLGRQRRTPPNRFRTGGTGVPPGKNALPSVTPAVSWGTPAEVSVIDPVTHPPADAETWPAPTVTDASGNPVPGTWTYTPAEGTTLTPGDNTVTGVFKPDDPAFGVTSATNTVRAEYIVPVDSAKKTGTGDNIIADPVTVREGDLLVAVVVLQTATTPTLSDNRGLAWAQAGGTVTSGSEKMSLWYAVVPTGAFGASATSGTLTVTVSGDVSAGYIGLALGAYRGNHRTDALHDVTAAATGSNDSPTTGSVLLNASGDLVVAGYCGAAGAAVSATASPVAGTLRQETFSTDTAAKVALADNTEATVGGTSKLTLGAALAWGAIAASFKKA